MANTNPATVLMVLLGFIILLFIAIAIKGGSQATTDSAVTFTTEQNNYTTINTTTINNISVTNVTNVTNITNYYNVTNVTGGNFTNGSTILVNNLFGGDADQLAGCSDRSEFSNSDVYVVLNTPGESLQELLCANIPRHVLHDIWISVDANQYNMSEDIFIPPYVGGHNHDYDGGQVRIVGYNGYVKINSFFASGITGQANPYMQYINITGYSPAYTGNCQMCIFGVQQAEFQEIVFDDQTGSAVYGITSYGSNVKIRTADFNGVPEYALETKQAGTILGAYLTGTVEKNPYFASQGNIYLDSDTVNTLASSSPATYSPYKTNLGFILVESNSYNNLSMVGVSHLPNIEALDFIKKDASGNLNYWDEANSVGWRIGFDGDDELQFYRKEWDGDIHLFLSMDRDGRNLVLGDGTNRHTLTMTSANGTEYACGVANGGAWSCT